MDISLLPQHQEMEILNAELNITLFVNVRNRTPSLTGSGWGVMMGAGLAAEPAGRRIWRRQGVPPGPRPVHPGDATGSLALARPEFTLFIFASIQCQRLHCVYLNFGDDYCSNLFEHLPHFGTKSIHPLNIWLIFFSVPGNGNNGI